MKSFFVILLVGVCSIAFGKNNVEGNDFRLLEKKQRIVPIKNKAAIEEAKILVAFEYYYTIDWLYSETPFSHKLEAYV